MPLVDLVIGLALLEYFLFSVAVARARGTYNVHAPATTGHEVFERYFRAHMNTLEQLVIFVPSMWIFGHWISESLATALGVLFIVGRFLYFQGYVKDPKKRSAGYGLSALPTLILLIGGIIGAARAALLQ